MKIAPQKISEWGRAIIDFADRAVPTMPEQDPRAEAMPFALLTACAAVYQRKYGPSGHGLLMANLAKLAPQPTPKIRPAKAVATKTPGVFYHGSPYNDLKVIESPFERFRRPFDQAGIYFTPILGFAQHFTGPTGRTYCVELITRNPLTTDDFMLVPIARVGKLLEAGHDALISNDGREVVILNPFCIRYLEPGMGE